MATSLENVLIEEAAKFDGYKELIQDDLEDEDPGADVYRNIESNIAEFKNQYISLKVAQTKFKSKLVPKSCSEEIFNATYTYTDAWLQSKKKEYQSVNKAVSLFLKNAVDKKNGTDAEEKFDSNADNEIKKLIGKINMESNQVEASIDESFKSLESLENINLNQAQVYRDLKSDLMNMIDEKIPAHFKVINSLAGTGHKEQIEKVTTQFDLFETKSKTRLYKLHLLLADKTQSGSQIPFEKSVIKTEAIHLKKTDPPTFSGKEEDYPEFSRKWAAIVGPARLPEEAELDRLREALPKDAEEMLIGITKLSIAWSILKKRYGDEHLIAIKLKNELKTLIIPPGLDHERLINLCIKVNSIVTRLKQLGASEALKYDGEFIAAVYFQLSNRHRQEWLKFDKTLYTDKWTALNDFLEDSYNKAVEEKVLLATLNPTNNKRVGNAGLAAAKVEEDEAEEDVTSQQVIDKKVRYEEARLKAGKCPLCKSEHTFRTRWTNVSWPSDRFVTCKRFSDMSTRQRAELIEKSAGCPRCTSWSHNKLQCTSQVIDCKEVINGMQCHKDHSRLVCNSGVAYCLSTKTEPLDTELFQPTLHYLQDVPVNNDVDPARILWDDGSNRVLVCNAFAAERNLRSRITTVTMKVVGGCFEKVKTHIYELDLVDKYGNRHSIWGYGIDTIIDPDDPVDLAPVRSLFPHLPDEVFLPMPKN